MKAVIMAALAAAGAMTVGLAAAQGDVVAQRRAGLRQMEAHLEAAAGIVQNRGDQAQILPRLEQMTAFYRRLPELFPAATLTPPLQQGAAEGQTRALAAIEANRSEFANRTEAMIAQIGVLRTAAQAGQVTGDMLRATGATCIACHRPFRAR